ncbi:50S ribosomal protein L33 [Candidatus Gottesmanbacteria bacterium]|nr:50S ribosomal protein L33 [Candidatus Gottesmanbacteria bacterium]
MATKQQRILVALVCSVCKSQNYLTERSKLNTPEKLICRKYCRHCRKHTGHKESGKLD